MWTLIGKSCFPDATILHCCKTEVDFMRLFPVLFLSGRNINLPCDLIFCTHVFPADIPIQYTIQQMIQDEKENI